MQDRYRVLPHRDIEQISSVFPGEMYMYIHKPCGMSLKERDVLDANWCPYCAKLINKAAALRARAEWK